MKHEFTTGGRRVNKMPGIIRAEHESEDMSLYDFLEHGTYSSEDFDLLDYGFFLNRYFAES